jgi:hypothetical protein
VCVARKLFMPTLWEFGHGFEVTHK